MTTYAVALAPGYYAAGSHDPAYNEAERERRAAIRRMREERRRPSREPTRLTTADGIVIRRQISPYTGAREYSLAPDGDHFVVGRELLARDLRALRAALRRRAFADPDPAAPDTLGWRAWRWDAAASCLVSPHQDTPWPDAELRVTEWDRSDVLRGVAGIHARRVPRDWRRAAWSGEDGAPADDGRLITGIVERFGRAVIGTTGWRAEWVIIRELMAPDVETALALMRRYPDVRVHVREQQESVR